MKGIVRLGLIAALLVGLVLAGCGDDDDDGGGSGGGSLNVAIVDNPQMKDIADLTPELFTKRSGIKVNYTILDEGTLRQVTTRDVAAGGRQFDVVMIGPFEAPQFGRDGFITDLTRFASEDNAYQLEDIIPSVRNALSFEGKLYAAPFYAESSFLMYRKDVLDGQRASRCLRSRPGTRSPTSRAESTARTWPASACAGSPAGATWAPRSPPC